MSAMVCGKRSFFEELATSPLVSKRIRCSSTSPTRLSPPRINAPIINNYNPFVQSSSPLPSDNPNSIGSPSAALANGALDRLLSIFPEMDIKLLERALEEAGDLESAIKSLNELRLGSAERSFPSVTKSGVAVVSSSNVPKNGAEWVELLVNEMTSACDMGDVRVRASRVLGFLEDSIRTRAGTEAADKLHKENVSLREEMEVLVQNNGILKRAVAIQHERQKEADMKNQELQHLKELLTQYQERLRTLEVNNYALTMHLRQAQSSSIPGRFRPDVY